MMSFAVSPSKVMLYSAKSALNVFLAAAFAFKVEEELEAALGAVARLWGGELELLEDGGEAIEGEGGDGLALGSEGGVDCWLLAVESRTQGR